MPLRTTVLGRHSKNCKAAVKSSFLSFTKHILIILLAVFFFIIYFYVNINFHLIEGACLCVFVLYILHCDILYSAHLGKFPASLLGPIVVHVASLCACFFKTTVQKSIIILSCL